MQSSRKISAQTLTLSAILTAMVVVLQLLGAVIRFGPFSISLVLVPIVLGAALCGPAVGAWLGLVFGFVVLISGDAAPFFAVSVPGTVITVLCKGVACGWCAGLTYRALMERNRTLAVAAAALVCPVVNTGLFLVGCRVFFYSVILTWAGESGESVIRYVFVGLAGVNFLVEAAVNMVLSPVIVRLLNISKTIRGLNVK